MAIVTRYFKPAATGLGDGTSVIDAAAIYSGAWSTVITGFNFASTDSLSCRILNSAGTYTVGASLASGLFTNPPTAANPLFFHGADSAGARLVSTQTNWQSVQPVTWDAALPVISWSGSTTISGLNNCSWRMLKFSGAFNNSVLGGGANSSADWVVIANSGTTTTATANTNALARITNSYISMSGTGYSAGLSGTSNSQYDNIRIQGNLSASTGNRQGVNVAGTTTIRQFSRITIFNHVGDGFIDSSVSAGSMLTINNILVANCTGNGIKLNATASQTGFGTIRNFVITGCGGYGVDNQSANIILTNGRLRHNTLGNFNNFVNFSTATGTDVTNTYASQVAADLDEYVNSTSFDFRTRFGCPIYGNQYGADQADQVWNRGALTGGKM